MNVLLLKSWLREYGPRLIGAQLTQIGELDSRSLVLTLDGDGGRLRLLFSVLEEYPVLALIPDSGAHSGLAAEAGEPAVSFAKALRFHLQGYRIVGLHQEGFDRSVDITFKHMDKYGKETLKQLRAELAPRSGNAFLLTARMVSRSDGNVISIFKRVRQDKERVRNVVTGKPLPPPPPLGKFIAAQSDSDGLAAELQSLRVERDGSGADDALREFFVRRIAGADRHAWPKLEGLLPVAHDIEALYSFIRQLQAGALDRELFISAQAPDFNSAALEHWAAARGTRKLKQGGGPRAGQAALATRLDDLREQLRTAARADELEQLALEMLGRAEEVDSERRSGLFLKGWSAANPDWAAELSFEASASENAQRLIVLAQRLRRGHEKLEALIAEAENKLARAETSAAAASPDGGLPAAPRSSDPLSDAAARLDKYGVKFLRFVSSDGLHFLCGQSQRSNEGLLRTYGSSRHLWLHVRDFTGSHVIVLSAGREVPQQTLHEAATVAAYFSQGRGENEVDVSYTPIKQLRRPKGGKPGQVLKLSERVISVRPADYKALRSALLYHAPQP